MKSAAANIDHACVVVLGDIGRSPRMQYHVKSLADAHYFVDLVGYVESKPLEDLTSNPNVRIHSLSPFPELHLPGLAKYAFKSCWQALTLLMVLVSIRKPKFVLCQNPPAIPTIVVVYIYCFFARSKMIIDWHNYTHTILAIASSPKSPVVRLAKAIESRFGRNSFTNLCVTRAMQQDLWENWNISAVVLYDRPPLQFHPNTIEEKHELFMDLAKIIPQFASAEHDLSDVHVHESSVFTYKLTNGAVKYHQERPALLISSTSWTPDEDFGILLAALDAYDTKASQDPIHYPRLLCVITGKGPLKNHYQALIKERPWQKVSVITPWLENDDYPRLLAAGDLGVCLHYSSSGLDLPMKVVDMFGCGLPVCAMKFKCIGELVLHGQNGFVFGSADELTSQLCDWFQDFPMNVALTNQKERIQQKLKEFQQLRWTENWDLKVKPLLERL
ncbi:chitobiosyldiphosphodolichol beta-mannosyltransferase [Armigeres subalbatus]|uniref:chitobiosyldiphosphodolichol beta-mannosyltransferase n=1 Tax=Armigeres subalbatus TaxID=124917 RepID=UPI002ED14610